MCQEMFLFVALGLGLRFLFIKNKTESQSHDLIMRRGSIETLYLYLL